MEKSSGLAILGVLVFGACGALGVADEAPSDAGSPSEASEASPEVRPALEGGGGADEEPERPPNTLPVRGVGPMLDCSEVPDCPDAGACGETFVDFGCDEAWRECGPGTHRDYRSGDSCSSCVADGQAPRTCAWARGRYPEFLRELTQNSCADFCDSAADCSASLIENACMSDLVLSLYGMINEEIIQAAESFSNENCAPLCGSEPAPSAEPPRGKIACVNHRCTFAD